MPLFNATALLVDDGDLTSIQYSEGWIFDQQASEVGHTKHGAAIAGLNATFKFTGTAVDVYGSLGSIDVYGQPVTTYAIDGIVLGTYVAPIIAPGFAYLNQSFFVSPILPAGDHELVITNINGTQPTTYWLDFLVYTPSVSLSNSTSVSSTPISGPSTSSTTNQPSSTSRADSTTSASTSSITSPITSAKSSRKNTGAIVGGVVGGVCLIALLLFLLYMLRVRRRKRHRRISVDFLAGPFVSWRGDLPPVVSGGPAFNPTSTEFVSPASSVTSPSSTNPFLPSEHGFPKGAMDPVQIGQVPAVVRHVDSGVRLGDRVMTLPPVYTRD
ncbi:hypothetical protein A0H81_09597 [Grifola frondosa]|uniref:Transmembrane protein n=1 Tax=Grifola frondosa TaxID=5627 RepID=A0A1C7M1U5_GRIFR|nr:hypothetical protein A0H81_09597 [Grifola frondosa]